jgi:hypothetical protein
MGKQVTIVMCVALGFGGCFFQAAAPALAVQPEDAEAHPVKAPASPPPTQTAPPSPSLGQEVHCDAEAKCLAKLRGIAGRVGENLSLKLDNGSTKLFTSTDACETAGESCVQTSLVGYMPSQHWFVLSAHYYESYGTILVSRHTGEVFRIEDSVPHFSPDGKRFVVAAFDEQDGINQVAIYGTNAFPPVREWSYKPKSFFPGFEFVAWNGDNQIRLREVVTRKSEATISHTSDGWKLTAADD